MSYFKESEFDLRLTSVNLHPIQLFEESELIYRDMDLKKINILKFFKGSSSYF